ncbi:MAG: tRNA (adenosine(37)-N6)-dimethylallyltransferase MiaA, partial [Muribaculaceae bacterium]|nr:tRNA (adenosine(37)-N6)-dimethylallyltransferase MiaA [Muribaculaceae bacterium]
HHFVDMLEPEEYYSAAQYESDVLALIERLRAGGHTCAVMCGGSMMYVDAVTRGLDDLPTISPEVRAEVLALYEAEGLGRIRAELERLDPEYLAVADPGNHRRLIHALEIIRQAGRKCSELRAGGATGRP